jgi:hypothetical protein
MRDLKVGGEATILDMTTNAVTFCDERNGKHEVAWPAPEGALASVTLSGHGSTWGEFLTLQEVAAVHYWTGELLRQAFVENDNGHS